MFSKKKEDYPEYERSEPAVQTSSDVRRRKTSVIGPTLKFKGELSANEDLIIEGEIEGTIAHQDKNLTVGKRAASRPISMPRRSRFTAELRGTSTARTS